MTQPATAPPAPSVVPTIPRPERGAAETVVILPGPAAGGGGGGGGDGARAAFFDLDNTLLRGASLYYLARVLAARRMLRVRDIARFGWQQLSFRMRGENTEHLASARADALAFVTGRRVSDLASVVEEVIERHVEPRLWADVRELADEHLAAGSEVWLVTAAPIELADGVARLLGLTGALATVPEAVEGVYTGRLAGELLHGPAKATAVSDLAALRGLRLAECAAYSDSANDIPMLSLVGHPCAVNPDAQLRRHARQHGWDVLDVRPARRFARRAWPAAGVGAVAAGGTAVAAVAVRRRAATHTT